MAEARPGTSPEGTAAPWQGRAYVGVVEEAERTAAIWVQAPGRPDVPLAFVDQWEHARQFYGEPAVNHPPGFAWGYAGSGPADTAASILADHFGTPQPRSVVQRFKHELIAPLPEGTGFILTGADVKAWAEANQALLAKAWDHVWAWVDDQAVLEQLDPATGPEAGDG